MCRWTEKFVLHMYLLTQYDDVIDILSIYILRQFDPEILYIYEYII